MSLRKDIEIDLSYLDDVSGGSSEFIVEMIDMFIAQTSGQVSTLEQALKGGDFKGIGDMVHKIKPTLAFIGLQDIQNVFSVIEVDARSGKNLDKIQEQLDNLSEFFEIVILKLKEKRADLSA